MFLTCFVVIQNLAKHKVTVADKLHPCRDCVDYIYIGVGRMPPRYLRGCLKENLEKNERGSHIYRVE